MSTVPEVRGLRSAIAAMQADPDMRRFNTSADVGGCWTTAYRFAWHLIAAGVPYTFRRWRNLPGQRTASQHAIEVDGSVVDWTFRQFEPSAAWPHVEAVATYEARGFKPEPCCPVCGSPASGHECVVDFDLEAPVRRAIARLNRRERRALDRRLHARRRKEAGIEPSVVSPGGQEERRPE